MNILVSVYACEPNKGSEPGGGWNWVLELSRRGYNIFVITRANNKENIESSKKKRSVNRYKTNITYGSIFSIETSKSATFAKTGLCLG